MRSSNVRRARYNRASRLLEVEFRNGGTYRYLRVPEAMWQGLLAAESKGTFLHEHMPDRYDYVRVETGASVAEVESPG